MFCLFEENGLKIHEGFRSYKIRIVLSEGMRGSNYAAQKLGLISTDGEDVQAPVKLVSNITSIPVLTLTCLCMLMDTREPQYEC
jgi:hypothetical protein